MSKSLLDFINETINGQKLTRDEFARIRRERTEEELEEAVEKMIDQGGYDNLD